MTTHATDDGGAAALAFAADDFFVNLNLQTVLDLPGSRETVLSFLEVIQKEFPELSNFYHREAGEFVLEGDHDRGTNPWLEIQQNRLTASVTLIEALVFALGAGFGLTLALSLMASIRERIELTDVPAVARRMGLVLVIASCLSMAFMGFAGMGSAE